MPQTTPVARAVGISSDQSDCGRGYFRHAACGDSQTISATTTAANELFAAPLRRGAADPVALEQPRTHVCGHYFDPVAALITKSSIAVPLDSKNLHWLA